MDGESGTLLYLLDAGMKRGSGNVLILIEATWSVIDPYFASVVKRRYMSRERWRWRQRQRRRERDGERERDRAGDRG